VATVGAIVFFIAGVVLGIYLGHVALRFGSSTTVGPHEALWMRCLTGLTIAWSALLGWLTHRVTSRSNGR
jgi:hypothetical protein